MLLGLVVALICFFGDSDLVDFPFLFIFLSVASKLSSLKLSLRTVWAFLFGLDFKLLWLISRVLGPLLLSSALVLVVFFMIVLRILLGGLALPRNLESFNKSLLPEPILSWKELLPRPGVVHLRRLLFLRFFITFYSSPSQVYLYFKLCFSLITSSKFSRYSKSGSSSNFKPWAYSNISLSSASQPSSSSPLGLRQFRILSLAPGDRRNSRVSSPFHGKVPLKQ